MVQKQIFRLDERVALVTGSGGRLGSTISKVLAEAGAHVILNVHRPRSIDRVKKEWEGSGLDFSIERFDIGNEREVLRQRDKIAKKFGKLDILINSACVGGAGTLDKAMARDYRDLYEVTVIAVHRLIQAMKPLLKKAAGQNAGGASIINIASMYGVVSPDPSIYGKSGMNNPPYYGAAKAALLQLTKYVACHLASLNIRVNAISPGPFPEPGFLKKNPAFHSKLRKKIPLGRVGRADELQGPVLFLASDASSFVTGANLVVDGGWMAW